ncbi:phytase [Pedobacter sp. MC2016-15]|uniref:phytase n=1 Tax=Pedobacter sp. MC2016-15 TaxID=2994473 RepID=UPI00224772B1|nr:phytase [Pedobacter sp. MC2016-15]MCX2480709.1 phytase [Pedobacter sp. MC2016-15]
MNRIYYIVPLLLTLNACNSSSSSSQNSGQQSITDSTAVLKPVVVTDTVQHDTDDPAIWINPSDPAKSLIVGTDKDSAGALYVFNLEGKIVDSVPGLKRPNNVDIAYGLKINGKATDIAVVTERETSKIRIYQLPEMKAIDNGGISVFDGETERSPMGISLYTAADQTIYAIVGRKTGPSGSYLWQYQLSDNGKGMVTGKVVRKFGAYSGKKEIESIASDNELGYIYYSDEQNGVHKYYADPAKGDKELALFAKEGFTDDHEGISIYKTGKDTGYILVSNQQKNTFMVYPREGNSKNPNDHQLITEIPVSTLESDGSEVNNLNLGPKFPKGMFVAMSNGKVFHFYDWRDLQKKIDAAVKK